MKKRITVWTCVLVFVLLAGTGVWVLQRHPSILSRLRQKTAQTVAVDPDFSCSAGEGLTRIVSAAHPMPEAETPDDLVNLYEHKERAFELARADISLRQCAFDAAQEMFTAAAQDGVEGFILSSGYRTRERQAELYADGSSEYVNRPGESEHETGLCFDVTARTQESSFDQTPQFAWLSEHASTYGFILRYPLGKETLTGVPYESWHYRYVGAEAAAEIAEKGWCLEEYNAD